MDGKQFVGGLKVSDGSFRRLKVSPALTGLAQPCSSSDWECPHCQGINFHWQTSCFRCRQPRERGGVSHLRELGYCQRQESQLRRRSPGRQERGRESPRAEGVWRKEQHQDRSRSRSERARSTLRSRSRSREESRQGSSRQSNSNTDSQRIEDIKEDFVKNMRRYEKRPFFFRHQSLFSFSEPRFLQNGI